ncbi:hypothetical protein IQ268_24650 [Oculatella sp. LEGE 06141]|uniref:hypothetical protein n=1 Tax=Oculatella sp. LEGE 06141 TaxID=1828648 RepID=UPI001881BB39|nr:hypothetical protein [Oculatella sp. LEGE 06141]MBE9181760.1 hypothetical protein [Oculatella sp. LEGE 06141]
MGNANLKEQQNQVKTKVIASAVCRSLKPTIAAYCVLFPEGRSPSPCNRRSPIV